MIVRAAGTNRSVTLSILCVAGVYPWPADDGYRQRLQAMIEALAAIGSVEFWCYEEPQPSLEEAPPPLGITVRWLDLTATNRIQRVSAWLTGLPRALVRRQPSASALGIEHRQYDLALFSHIDAWYYFGFMVDAPTIVDFDNLLDVMLRSKRSLGHRRVGGRARGLRSRAVAWSLRSLRALPDRVDERRFAEIQRRCAGSVHTVTLCSQLDVWRSGLRNARCIPNGYTLQSSSLADRAHRPNPVMLFVGLLSWPPNADAITWFATAVLPIVRSQVPDARFRIVGRGGDGLGPDLASIAGVELVGGVDDLQTELDAATVSVVPIRFGGGTRLKVVEAMANRLPLVTTTIGCEGIDVVNEVHCLVCDDETSLALGCVRLLSDAGLRSRLADAGETLYEERYRWVTIQGSFGQLALDVAATSSSGGIP